MAFLIHLLNSDLSSEWNYPAFEHWGPGSLWKLKKRWCLLWAGNSFFASYFLTILYTFQAIHVKFWIAFHREESNVICFHNHTSNCNNLWSTIKTGCRHHLKIKTYRALKKFKCFIHIFNLVYPQLAPSYIVKEKLLLHYMRAHACIAPLISFHFFVFHLVLNFYFILKGSWWSWLLKFQSFCESSRKIRICM